jgi:hypothetical protein
MAGPFFNKAHAIVDSMCSSVLRTVLSIDMSVTRCVYYIHVSHDITRTVISIDMSVTSCVSIFHVFHDITTQCSGSVAEQKTITKQLPKSQ